MAEATPGTGGTSLEGERGKRPPPEGEPAAPAAGVLGRCAAAASVRVAGAWSARGGRTGRGIGVSRLRSGVQSRGRPLLALRLRQGGRDQNGAAGGGPSAETRTRPSRSPDWRLRPVTPGATDRGRAGLRLRVPLRKGYIESYRSGFEPQLRRVTLGA